MANQEWKVLKTFRPDAVVLDLMLPKMTGVDFMKTSPRTPGFSATFPSSFFPTPTLTNMVQEAWKAGANQMSSPRPIALQNR